MIINTNINTRTVIDLMNKRSKAIGTSTERLSSGMRINHSVDDPSGLAISTAMKAQIRGQNVAIQNIQDGINLMRVQNAGLNEIMKLVQRMRDLAVRASNDATLTSKDLEKMDRELNAALDEVDRIAKATDFNENIHVLLGNPTTTTTDLEFEVLWWTANSDIDMHVIQPDGAHAWYADQNPNGHGEIDVDDVNGSSGPADPAVEHYNVASGAALTGNYELWINYYAPHGAIPPDTAIVTISMYRGTPYENIQTFNVNVPYQQWNDPYVPDWDGDPFNDIGPFGEVFVGSYFWQPLSVSITAKLQIGPDNKQVYIFEHDFFESRRSTLGIATASLANAASAQASIGTIDEGIANINNYLAEIGQRERWLTQVVTDLSVSNINLMAANSRIEDADIASEIANLTVASLIVNAGMSAQLYANTMLKDILTLMEPVM